MLDLGCGNGWFALELARAGFDVTAVDLSPGNIEVAQETASAADLSPGHGSITYIAADLHEWQPPVGGYDAACFNGSLHHLPGHQSVLARCLRCLVPGGYVMAVEPLPYNNEETEAAVALAIRLALSGAGAWYEKLPLLADRAELARMVGEVRDEYYNWADKTESSNQSSNNNSTDGAEILVHLRGLLEPVAEAPFLPLQHRLIGGMRLPDQGTNVQYTQTWIWIEESLVEADVLKPGGFLFFGRTRPQS